MIKPRGEGLFSLLYNPPNSFPDGPFMSVSVLGCSFLEESYLSLTIQPSSRDQEGRSKGDRGCAPVWRIQVLSH